MPLSITAGALVCPDQPVGQGWAERARNVRVPMTPFLMLHTRVLLPEDEKHARTLLKPPLFLSLTRILAMKNRVFSLIYSPRIITPDSCASQFDAVSTLDASGTSPRNKTQ